MKYQNMPISLKSHAQDLGFWPVRRLQKLLLEAAKKPIIAEKSYHHHHSLLTLIPESTAPTPWHYHPAQA